MHTWLHIAAPFGRDARMYSRVLFAILYAVHKERAMATADTKDPPEISRADGRNGQCKMALASPNPLQNKTALALENEGQSAHHSDAQKIVYTSRFVRVILAQGPC